MMLVVLEETDFRLRGELPDFAAKKDLCA